MEIFTKEKALILNKESLPFDRNFFFSNFLGKSFFELSMNKSSKLDLFEDGAYRSAQRGELERSNISSLKLRASSLQTTEPMMKNLATECLEKYNLSFNVNIYYSCESKAQSGFHWDYNPMIIFQALGDKKWEFKYSSGEQESFIVQEGEFLYIPRRLEHNALAGNSSESMHCTLSFDCDSYFELFLFLFRQLENPNSFDLGHGVKRFRELLEDPSFEDKYWSYSLKRKLALIKDGYKRFE